MSPRRPRTPDELRHREEDQQRKLADLNDRLLAELWALRTGEDWAVWLNLAARLPGHSFTNLLLISAQAPGATRVAGYQEWREQGRQVSSGEPGIPVLGGTRPPPSVTPPARQRRGAPRVPDQVADRPSGRSLAYVWDITQTTGPFLPRMPSPHPAASGAWDALTWLARREGFTVERAPASTGTSLTAWDARRIRIQPDLDEPDAARALAHELGHVLLHRTGPPLPGTSTAGCRGVHKIEADSTAFIIAARLGISTSPCSWPDVASWAGTDVRARPAEVIKATGTRISTAAETIAAHLGITLPAGHGQQTSHLLAHSPGPSIGAEASRAHVSKDRRDTGRTPRTRPQDLPGQAGTQPEGAERSRATTRHGSTPVTGIAAPGEARPLPGTPAAGAPQLAVPQQPSSYRPAGARSLVAGSPGKAAMPEPLNSTDIMLALRHGGAPGLTSLIQAIDDQSGLASLPARLRPYRGTRAAGEPSEGARESVTAIPEGLRIDIAATPPRAGTVPWWQIIDAVGPGLTPARRQILLRAHQTILGYTDARTGFQVIGERDLAAAAERELRELAESTASAAITAAWQAREAEPGPARTAGKTPASTPHPAGAMQPAAQDPGPALHSTSMTTASAPGWLRSELRTAIAAQTDGWALARIERLASVLPPWPAERAVRVSRLESGDILQHPGHPDAPFRVLTVRHDQGDVIEITGTLTGPAVSKPADPVAWQLRKTGNDDPLVGVLALPQSLRGLADEAGPSRPTRQAAPSPRAPEVAPAQSPSPAPRPAADPPPGRHPHTTATASEEEAMASTTSGAAGPPAAGEDTGLGGELAGVLAALTSRRPAQPAPAPETNGRPPAPPPSDIADINAAFAGLRRELGLPAAEPGHDASVSAPGPAVIHHESPAQSMQARHSPAPPYEGFADINAAFAELRQALGLPAADPSHDPSGHGDRGPAADADGLREMCDAIAEAQACATWYRDTPEWQRITRVSDAARALMAAIRETAGDYWSEIRQDIRVRGFARTVAARTSLAIAGPAWVLASKLDKAGHQHTRPWRAAHGLHRAATSSANRLMHYIPPGNSDRIRDAAQIISKLSSPSQNPQTQERSRHGGSSPAGQASASSPAALARTSFPEPISGVPPQTAPGITPHSVAQPTARAEPGRRAHR